MIIVTKRKGVKIRLDGKDRHGKVTTRSLLVSDADVDQVMAVVKDAIEAQGKKK